MEDLWGPRQQQITPGQGEQEKMSEKLFAFHTSLKVYKAVFPLTPVRRTWAQNLKPEKVVKTQNFSQAEVALTP